MQNLCLVIDIFMILVYSHSTSAHLLFEKPLLRRGVFDISGCVGCRNSQCVCRAAAIESSALANLAVKLYVCRVDVALRSRL